MVSNPYVDQEIIKDALLKHAQAGGISLADLKKELSDVPEDTVDSVVENLLFGGQLEETDDGKLLMVNFF
jgi:hypothetical protein